MATIEMKVLDSEAEEMKARRAQRCLLSASNNEVDTGSSLLHNGCLSVPSPDPLVRLR